jgi:hypothetical protein
VGSARLHAVRRRRLPGRRSLSAALA